MMYLITISTYLLFSQIGKPILDTLKESDVTRMGIRCQDWLEDIILAQPIRLQLGRYNYKQNEP